MAAWLAWSIAAVALVVGEILTPGLFFLGPVALAAIAGAVASLFGAPLWLQLLVFAGSSLPRSSSEIARPCSAPTSSAERAVGSR